MSEALDAFLAVECFLTPQRTDFGLKKRLMEFLQSRIAVETVADELRRHRALYYKGTPAITDAEFDALEELVRDLAPSHPILAEIGPP